MEWERSGERRESRGRGGGRGGTRERWERERGRGIGAESTERDRRLVGREREGGRARRYKEE